MVRLISGNVDLSGNPRGWLAPTGKQPVFASFYNTGFAGDNLVSGGTRAQVVGAPKLTAGVVGAELPYMTTAGALNYLATSIQETASGTIIAIARMPTPTTGDPTDGVIVGNYDFYSPNGNTMLLFTAAGAATQGALRGRVPYATPAGWNVTPPLTSNMTGWLLCALRWNCVSGGTGSATVQCLTLGTSAVSSGTGINAGMGTVPLWIGGQPNCNTGAQAG
ncbi:hypothetical protein HKD24_15025, partial [Gluconobacter sp. LMG 31484]